MWFKSKPKNRRLGRAQVLNVKLRSDQVRASRVRLASIFCAVLFGTAAGFAVLWLVGKWTMNRLVYDNSAFAIRNIDVQTDGVIALDQLRRWAEVKPGQNLFALDLGNVKRKLEMVPLIASVSVERTLPGTLRLRVAEREPIAQVAVNRAGGGPSEVFNLDTEGCVMSPLDPRQRAQPLQSTNESLPILQGVNLTELRAGRFVESRQTLAALRLITEFAYSPMAGIVDLKIVDVSSPEVLIVTTGQGSEVTFALNDLDRQLRRWREIYDRGRRYNKMLATLDLAVSNNVPASWLEANNAQAQAPAKAPKKVRIKKRNV